jgi:tripartite-type tricarboxylate transporter receptor subunit TctC
MKPILSALVTVAAMLALAGPGTASAQGRYPSKPVRIVVPFAPGGATDFVARFLADRLTRRTGQTFIVDNRVGAGGVIGIQSVYTSPPDGYTLLVASGSYAVNPAVMKLPYDSVRDAAPVVNVTFGPVGFVVHPSIPATTLGELIAHLKANPGKLNYSCAGIGNVTHLAMEAFLADTGTSMTHAPYKGMAPALTGVASGEVQMALTDIGSAHGLISAGRIKMIAVGGDRRLTQFPNVPTTAESGYPKLVAGVWQGMFAPAGTPAAVIDELNAHVNEILRDKEALEQLTARFQTPIGGTPAAFAATLKADIERFAEVARKANIKPE